MGRPRPGVGNRDLAHLRPLLELIAMIPAHVYSLSLSPFTFSSKPVAVLAIPPQLEGILYPFSTSPAVVFLRRAAWKVEKGRPCSSSQPKHAHIRLYYHFYGLKFRNSKPVFIYSTVRTKLGEKKEGICETPF